MFHALFHSQKARMVPATISLLSCQTLYMFYVTGRSVSLPSILSDLDGLAFYSLCIVLSPMIMAVATPVAGKLGDLFGCKRIYLLGLSGFALSMVLCAIAPNIYVFLLGVGLSGLGNGIVYPQILTLIVDIYSEKTSPKMLGFFSMSASVASLIGPIVGGLCADYASWRALFYILVPLSLLNLGCALVGIPDVRMVQKETSIDYLGTFWFALCVIPILYVLSAAGTLFAWMSVTAIGLLVLSAVSLVLLLKVERHAKNPIIPLALFGKRTYLMALALTLVCGLCYSGINYLPMYYQDIRGMSSTLSGFITLPRQVGAMAAAVGIGTYFSRYRNYRRGAIIPMVLFVIGLGMIATFSTTTPLVFIFAAEIAYGCANGGTSVTPNAMAQHYLSRDDLNSGLAFLSFVSTFGTAFGSALTGSIINYFWAQDALNTGINTAMTVALVWSVIVLAILLVCPWTEKQN